MPNWTDIDIEKYDIFQSEAYRGYYLPMYDGGKDKPRFEPLLLRAMRLGETKIFLMLLHYTWDPNARFGARNYTILMHCVENYGGSLCMQYLMQAGLRSDRPLEKRVNMSMTDINFNTALHIAAYKGNIDCVYLLLGTEAPVHERNRYGKTPLDIATDLSRGEEAQRFIEIQHMLREYTKFHVRLHPHHPILHSNDLL